MDSFEESDSSEQENGFLLFLKRNSDEGTLYPLSEGTTTIGASLNADVRIKLEDVRLEAIHCVIEVNENRIATIINKSSKYPITVNNSIVRKARILRHEDLIEIFGKRIQYKNEFLTEQEIGEAEQKLPALYRNRKKSPIPISQTERKPIIVSKALPHSTSKRRMSLQEHRYKNQTHLLIPKVSHKLNMLKPPQSNAQRFSNNTNCSKDTSRKSNVKTPRQQVYARTSIRNSTKTRQSRNKIISFESENLQMSALSPLPKFSLSENDTEEDVFIDQSHTKESKNIGDLASLEYLLVPEKPICSESEIEENVSPTYSSPALNDEEKKLEFDESWQGNSVFASNISNNIQESGLDDSERTDDNVSSRKLSSTKKSTKKKSLNQSSASRKSLKRNQPDGILQKPKLEDNIFSTNVSLFRKTVGKRKSVQLNKSFTMEEQSCITDESIIPTSSSVRKSTGNKSLQIENYSHIAKIESKANTPKPSRLSVQQSFSNTTKYSGGNSIRKTNLKTPRQQQYARTTVSNSTKTVTRRSRNKIASDESEYLQISPFSPLSKYSMSETDTEDNSISYQNQNNNSDNYIIEDLSPLEYLVTSDNLKNDLKSPGTRKSRQRNGQESELEEKCSSHIFSITSAKTKKTRNSAPNKSLIRTPGKTLKMNQSEVVLRKSDTRESSVRKTTSNGRSTKSNKSFNMKKQSSSNDCGRVSRLSSVKKSITNNSKNQMPNRSNSSLSSTSAVEDLLDYEIESDTSKTKTLSSPIKSISNTSGSRLSSQFYTEENCEFSTILSEAGGDGQNKSQICTPNFRKATSSSLSKSVRLRSQSTNCSNFENQSLSPISLSTTADTSLEKSRRRSSTRASMSHVQTTTNYELSILANDSLDISRSEFEQHLSPSKMSSARKATKYTSSNSNSRASKEELISLEDVNNSVKNSKSLSNTLVNLSESEKTMSVSNVQDNVTKRPLRIRKSTAHDDFIYGSFTSEVSFKIDNSNKYDSTTLPLYTYINNKSCSTKESEYSNVNSTKDSEIVSTVSVLYDNDSLINATDANLNQRSSRSIVQTNLSTPNSPRVGSNISLPYQPITEDITPGTPVDNTEVDIGIKTPLNTPHLFKNIRKSVLQSRERKSVLQYQDRLKKSCNRYNKDTPSEKSKKRPRESAPIIRSNKRIKLTVDENHSYDEGLSSFTSFTSDEVFEEDDPHDVAAGTPKHIIDLTNKPVITYPLTRFSTKLQQNKPITVRKSLPSLDQIQNKAESLKSNRRSLQISTFSTTDVGETISESMPTIKSPTPKKKTNKVQKEPNNDLSNVEGVNRLFRTPRVPKTPKNDLTNIPPIKKFFTTPKQVNSPKNDLTSIPHIKKIFATPKKVNSPKNDLTDIPSVKNFFATPKKVNSPKNDLTNIPCVKKIFSTPRKINSPKNDLTKVPNLRKIMSPKQQNSPKNDLTDVRGIKKLLEPAREHKEPLNDLTDVHGLKKLMSTPKVQKQPLNDLSDVEGVANIFNTSVNQSLSNASDIENNEDLFNRIFNKKVLKTYRSKSMSPQKQFDAYGAIRKSIGDQPEVSPRVSVWVKEQKELKKKVAPIIRSKGKNKRKEFENVQCLTVSLTKEKTDASKESEKVKTKEELNFKTLETRSTRRKKENNEMEIASTSEEIEGRKDVEIDSDIQNLEGSSPNKKTRSKLKASHIVEENATPNSPKPVRGRRNATKKVKNIEEKVKDTVVAADTEVITLDSSKSNRRRRNKTNRTISNDTEPMTLDSPKPVRGKAIKKVKEIEKSSEDTVTVNKENITSNKDLDTLDSSKPVRGRRNATKKLEDTEEVTRSIEATTKNVRGNWNASKKADETEKSVEKIATFDSPKSVSGRRNATRKVAEIEEPVEDITSMINGDMKTTVRTRRNAGKNNTLDIEHLVEDSPKLTTRGRRNKKIVNYAESSERVKTNIPSVEENPVVDLPKVKKRGRRNINKNENIDNSLQETSKEETVVGKRGRKNATRKNTLRNTSSAPNSESEVKKQVDTKSILQESNSAVESPKVRKRKINQVESNIDGENCSNKNTPPANKRSKKKAVEDVKENLIERDVESIKSAKKSKISKEIDESEDKQQPVKKSTRAKKIAKKHESEVDDSPQVITTRRTRRKKVHFEI
ncbi:uncharacterized protein LOC130443744 [Diorhabda sublineata]|uniref:uncharacterized protein LOC130443744 n=1 Tax=Diorhabda sublineata TaxID=1163346 RepID=UPI0024E0FB7F|nr:uncharacterized protein LOC130443744 [Diorhabda sublineata]XP_056634500.1 uncharacterized protein LOC130443744 [Diorhabda sublineata]